MIPPHHQYYRNYEGTMYMMFDQLKTEKNPASKESMMTISVMMKRILSHILHTRNSLTSAGKMYQQGKAEFLTACL
jgi:hypothetical protein